MDYEDDVRIITDDDIIILDEKKSPENPPLKNNQELESDILILLETPENSKKEQNKAEYQKETTQSNVKNAEKDQFDASGSNNFHGTSIKEEQQLQVTAITESSLKKEKSSIISHDTEITPEKNAQIKDLIKPTVSKGNSDQEISSDHLSETQGFGQHLDLSDTLTEKQNWEDSTVSYNPSYEIKSDNPLPVSVDIKNIPLEMTHLNAENQIEPTHSGLPEVELVQSGSKSDIIHEARIEKEQQLLPEFTCKPEFSIEESSELSSSYALIPQTHELKVDRIESQVFDDLPSDDPSDERQQNIQTKYNVSSESPKASEQISGIEKVENSAFSHTDSDGNIPQEPIDAVIGTSDLVKKNAEIQAEDHRKPLVSSDFPRDEPHQDIHIEHRESSASPGISNLIPKPEQGVNSVISNTNSEQIIAEKPKHPVIKNKNTYADASRLREYGASVSDIQNPTKEEIPVAIQDGDRSIKITTASATGLIPSKETTHISPASFDAKRIETLSDNTSIKDEVPEKTEVCPYCGCEKNPNSVKCIECGQYFAKKPPVKTSDPASIEVQEPRSQGIIRGIVYMVIGVILFYFGLTVLRGGLINWISDIASIMIFLSGLESIYHSITKPSSG